MGVRQPSEVPFDETGVDFAFDEDVVRKDLPAGGIWQGLG